MKKKPMNFTQADVEKFRNVNHEVPEEVKEPENKADVIPLSSGMDARITKTVRMRQRFSVLLKEEAYKRSMRSGTKVSEADLLDEALGDMYLRLQMTKD